MVLHQELLINGTFIGGPCDQSVSKQVVKSPFDGSVVGTAAEADESYAMSAVEAAGEAFESWSRSPRTFRQSILLKSAKLLESRIEEYAELMAREIGKPLELGQGELRRGVIVLKLSAGLLDRQEMTDFAANLDSRAEDFSRIQGKQFPVGPVMCITPYNWPFNLALHKLGPALAAGCTIVLKGSSDASLCTLALARLFHEAGVPAGVLNAINCPSEIAEKIVLDDRIKKLSFTGSPRVGWHLKQAIPKKKVTLELGGNAFVICDDPADIDEFVKRTVNSGIAYAGQICISAQNVVVNHRIYSEVRERMIAAVSALHAGNPLEAGVICGPVIKETAADRIEDWLQQAVGDGAQIIAGGGRKGNLVEPTLIEGVRADQPAYCDEIFGPVLTLSPYDELEDAIRMVNDSDYAIHTSIFTQEQSKAEGAFQELQTAGVVVNDAPSIRFDAVPYGGIKESGFGREAPTNAWDEFTEWKSFVQRK